MANPSCPHTKELVSREFKRILWRKFLAKDLTSSDEEGESTKPKPANDDYEEPDIVLQCEECRNNDISTLWICINCGKLLCLEETTMHMIEHFNDNDDCHIFLSCLDSHIFCCSCEAYIYPREVAGASMEDRMTRFAEKWLQIYGRTRVWWRSLGTRGSLGCRGLKNYGNTCFFSSTTQALLHCRVLVDQMFRRTNDEKEIESKFRTLCTSYWKAGEDPKVINPKAFWGAVKENALYGQYADEEMEDSATLLIDIFNGMDEKMIQGIFGYTLESCVKCNQCSTIQSETSASVQRLLGVTPAVGEIVAEYAVGGVLKQESPELTIAVALVEEQKPSGEQEDSLYHKILLQQNQKDIQLSDALFTHFAEEKIPDYRCGGCSVKGNATKKAFLKSTSAVLVLHLKRFGPVKPRVQVKSHRKVHLPNRLDLSSFAAPGYTLPQYNLYAMVVHDGGLGGGHYMAYVRKRKAGKLTDQWLWFSDRYFGPVDTSEVEEAEPYIVFYERDD